VEASGVLTLQSLNEQNSRIVNIPGTFLLISFIEL